MRKLYQEFVFLQNGSRHWFGFDQGKVWATGTEGSWKVCCDPYKLGLTPIGEPVTIFELMESIKSDHSQLTLQTMALMMF
jgi:hypothetical protein